ncbi:MAG: DMT family transporter [Candidatus Methanofastidiosia archaeon]|jgi:drug/metabolite transporter (DMT)-like permease
MNKGVFLAALAGISWGTIPLAVKQIYTLGPATALDISFFRFLIAFIFLGGYAFLRKRGTILKNKWSVLMGFWGIFWMSVISFYGIRFTTAVNATILFNANPLFVAVLMVLLKWEKLTVVTVSGVVLGIAGVVMVSGGTTLYAWGDFLVLIGAFGWAVYTVLGYKLRNFSSVSVTVSSLFYGLLFFGVVIWRDVPCVTGSSWVWVAYIGIIPTAAAFLSYIKAVDLIGSTKASVFQYLAPAVAVIISVVLRLEQVSLFQIFGILFIVAGIELTRRNTGRY